MLDLSLFQLGGVNLPQHLNFFFIIFFYIVLESQYFLCEPIFVKNIVLRLFFDIFSTFDSINHPSRVIGATKLTFFMHNFLVLCLCIFLYYCFYIANLEIPEVYLLCKWDYSNTLMYKMCHVMLLWHLNWLWWHHFFVLAISQIFV